MALDPSAGISVLMQPGTTHRSAHGEDTAAWMDLIAKHKELADLHHLFLVRVFDPLIPSTFSQLAVKYNIPSRLWQVSFHLILERLRLAWMTAHPSALDLLTDLVYDAYKFYTDLLEDQAMSHFRTAWIEALGDLARYRMNIASHVSSNGGALDSRRGTDYRPRSRDDLDGPAQSSGASIGAEVAESWDVEDQETWRTTARDWYSMGVTEKPGEGRLHHHLALLCRDVPGLEPRALHHFTKSLVVTHEYATSRETILPLFDSALQSQRSLPEAKAVDLFVRLHGMLFTKIDLDNFKPVMSRYMERLDEDARLDHANRPTNISQVDWMIMASVNLAAMLQYGSPTGVIRKAFAMEGQERRRAHAVLEDDHEGEDDAERAEGSDEQHHGSTLDSTVTIPPAIPEESTTMPMVLTDAIEMTMEVFSFLLSTPFRQQGLQTVLNPYLTCLLTFIATAFRQTHIGDLLLPHVPWYPLVEFFNKYSPEIKEETKLVSHIPLPEDWALRGMEWVGRRVYERGFWKTKSNSRNSGGVAQPHSGERFASEMDVLLANFDSSLDISQGVVEEAEDTDLTDGPTAVNARRWRRVAWAAGVMVKHMDGLELRDGKVVITGSLKRRLDDISSMKEIQRIQEEEAMFRRKQRQQEEEDLEIAEQIESEIEDGDPEMAALRERRRRLRSMLDSALPRPSSKPKKSSRKSLHAMPGYTTLVFDTNVLLSSLELVKRVIDGGQWKVVVPLPVITELDGLSRNPPPLGESASLAITYLEARVRSHSRNLKIQTSKGNYLSDLTIRAESHHDAGRTDGTTMDDLILNVASFQSEHFRSNAGSNAEGGGAIQVLMVTFDRNLRLRARARGIEAADEKEMVGVWGSL
ncbi:hypothetical protein BD324DRAFT_580049 [Kockovaella imperatae]|uniref:PIN domain-containing protein n=1 Tax=Kockovaella imperatae TaxID=4999 RepID=A0A1Y1UGF1_9TREE|nr:hypothetical protein BD324DRAFT_580049 [Kockovaella imperatae]ORX36586.1 hypothetical protein BD324DRAFT_580049 [Kockovaella imperatae]